MTTRRELLIALGAGALTPLASFAQQKADRIVRIGRLSPLSASADAHNFDTFRQALRDLGWVEGRGLTFEYRYSEGNASRLPDLAAELVRLNVDVIVPGSTPGALAAKNATRTIPIVMVTTRDPVAAGLVTGLARPGGNLTGLTVLGRELNAKRLELLKEAFPGVTRIAVLSNPANPEMAPMVKGLEVAARSLGAQLRILEARDPAQFEAVFAAIPKERAGAIMVVADALFNTHRSRLVELVAKSRLPAMHAFREDPDAGGLMFYGASIADMYRRAATYVDKILKGAKPADLPIEQPTQFELVINMRTAKVLGIRIPQSLLLRADKVIE